MDKSFDVCALGELLIDFTDDGKTADGDLKFGAHPGGAPCNVLSLLQKMGKKTTFIGKVGQDFFGEFLRKRVSEVGIDLSGLLMDETVPTTLAFVKNTEEGDRDFSFYRNPGADMCLRKEEVKEELIQQSKIFHFGTLSMTHPGIEEATKRAITLAEESGCLCSFDPNLREPLWGSLELAKEKICYGLQHCDILKISDNEIQFVSGIENVQEGMHWILQKYHPKIAFATLGKEGSIAYYKGREFFAKGMISPDTIDTTGAGDCFMGSVLTVLLEKTLEDLTDTDIWKMLEFANTAASIVTTRKGALCVMPDRKEVLSRIL